MTVNEQLYIFVMERGFVLVGIPEQDKDDFLFWKLAHCGVIRLWGTTRGLGQLAVEGPQGKTVIDREPDGTAISKNAIYRRIPCDMRSWQKWLAS
jgi:hypothetical protein